MSLQNSRQISDVKVMLCKGIDGEGIESIEKTGTSGLVDTYTITFTGGNKTTFTVTNGKGITSIAKTATSGLVDTYTITYNDNTTSTFTVTNGKGISNIAKTGTSGLIDTYTITFNDGSTSTFTVTNGTNGSNANLADVAPSLVAQKDYDVNEHIIYDDVYYIVTQPVLEGENLVVGTNIEERKVGDEISFIANIRVDNSILYLPRTGVSVADGVLNINMFN